MANPEPGPVDLSAKAPAPEEPVVEGPPTEPLPGPPPRAALDKLPPGFSSNPGKLSAPVAKFATGPAVVGDKAEQDKDDDGDGEGAGIAVSHLSHPHIASKLLTFLNELKRPGQHLGISAFILFTIAFGIQVNVSLKTERENNLCLCHKYWDTDLASLYIPG